MEGRWTDRAMVSDRNSPRTEDAGLGELMEVDAANYKPGYRRSGLSGGAVGDEVGDGEVASDDGEDLVQVGGGSRGRDAV
jgi:hypothetical protein